MYMDAAMYVYMSKVCDGKEKERHCGLSELLRKQNNGLYLLFFSVTVIYQS